MQNDEIIWQVINHSFCSFKSKIAKEQAFCRNVYNVTGLCNRSSCPLANSRYATIREHEGRIYLYMKTIERAHTPAKLWERIKLSQNYTKALETVSEQLEHWPKALQHRNKQRLTKIYQYLVRSRRLKLKKTSKLVAVNTMQDKLETRREVKALKAAKLENSIKGELLQRLKRGTYGEIYNFPETAYNAALDEVTPEDAEALQLEEDEEAEEEDEELEEEYEDDEDTGLVEYVADFQDGDEEELEYEEEESDIEDTYIMNDSSSSSSSSSRSVGGKSKKGSKDGRDGKPSKRQHRGPRVEVEYEREDEEEEEQKEQTSLAW
jgi:protein MAK16